MWKVPHLTLQDSSERHYLYTCRNFTVNYNFYHSLINHHSIQYNTAENDVT